jgi:hypothetical protein
MCEGVTENFGPFTLKDLAMPLETGAGKEADDDIADILFVSLKVGWIAIEIHLQFAKIGNRWRFQKRENSFLFRYCGHGSIFLKQE